MYCTRLRWPHLSMAFMMMACLAGCATKSVSESVSPAVQQHPVRAAMAPATVVRTPAGATCVSLDEVDNTWTPEDLYAHMLACVEQGDYGRASDLNMLAGIFENYDIRRTSSAQVSDGFAILTQLTFAKMTDEQVSELGRGRHADLATVMALCPKVMHIGAPTYVPLYLTRYHRDPAGNPVAGPPADHVDTKPDFDVAKNWAASINPILHCNGH